MLNLALDSTMKQDLFLSSRSLFSVDSIVT